MTAEREPGEVVAEADGGPELVVDGGDAAGLCPELEALVLAGGIPCPPAPGWIWHVAGGVARCVPWTDPSEQGAALRERFERVLAAWGPGWFPVLVKTAQRVVFTAMEKSLFRPPEKSSPGRTFQQLAALLVQAGHAAAGLDQVILAEAVPYEDVPGAYQVLVTSAAPDALSADQRERLDASPRTASATRILITLQRPGQPVLMRAVSAFRTTDGGVVEGGMTLSPGIAARFLAGGYPCPAPPGHIWVSQGLERSMIAPPLPACPFCGGQPALTKLTCQGQGCGACTSYQLACTNCQLGLPPQPSPEEAKAAWRTGVTQALQIALALKVDIAAAGQRLVAREGA